MELMRSHSQEEPSTLLILAYPTPTPPLGEFFYALFYFDGKQKLESEYARNCGRNQTRENGSATWREAGLWKVGEAELWERCQTSRGRKLDGGGCGQSSKVASVESQARWTLEPTEVAPFQSWTLSHTVGYDRAGEKLLILAACLSPGGRSWPRRGLAADLEVVPTKQNQPATSGRNRPPASPAGQPGPDPSQPAGATLKQARAPFASRAGAMAVCSTRCPILPEKR